VHSLQTSHLPSGRRLCARLPRRLLAGLLLSALAAPAAAWTSQATSCAQRPEFAWLDFWIGDWRVFVGEQQVGTNAIHKVLDGCAITEDWADARGGSGRSLFYVSPVTGQWRQVWVTNTALAPGGVKEKRLIARYPDGGIRFQGEIAAGDTVVLDRTTLRPVEDGRVRQTIERSQDGGVTWITGFDAMYVRVQTK
jgi:hypothetical protein